MTDLAHEEARVLAGARRAFTPAPNDAERIRAALGAALTGAAISEAASAAPASKPSTGPAPGASSTATSGVRLLGRLALPALVAAGGFAGYELGYRAGFREGSAVAAKAAQRPVIIAPSVPAATVAEGTAPKLPEPVAVSTAPTPLSKGAPAPSGSEGAAATEPGLDEEVRQLKRVEHALRSGNPRYALALLGELERQVPGGQLAEERDAARAMARCALGGSEALAREFEAAHPGSAYAARVTESCKNPPKGSP